MNNWPSSGLILSFFTTKINVCLISIYNVTILLSIICQCKFSNVCLPQLTQSMVCLFMHYTIPLLLFVLCERRKNPRCVTDDQPKIFNLKFKLPMFKFNETTQIFDLCWLSNAQWLAWLWPPAAAQEGFTRSRASPAPPTLAAPSPPGDSSYKSWWRKSQHRM